MISLSSCINKHVAAPQDDTRQTFTSVNDFNSVIEAKVLAQYKADKKYNTTYQEYPSFADVQIIKILKKGQNYHGQFEEGKSIRIFFNFTMNNTEEIFPELNQALPGLKKNDVFQAELFEKEGGSPAFTVQLYTIKDL